MEAQSDYSNTENAVTFWSALTLAVMAVTSLLLRYVMDPMTCFTPSQFRRTHVAYTSQYCFHSQSMYVVHIPEAGTYHQWIPFFLGACAVLCLLPLFLRWITSAFLWIDVHTLMHTIGHNQKSGIRHVIMRDLAVLLQAGLKKGNYVLTLATMGRKASTAAVCFVELVLMAKVFRPQLNYTKETEQGDHHVSIPLPVTDFYCFFQIHQRSNQHYYTVQCVMPQAEVYSKGLAFLFYLFLVLFVLCALDMAVWAGRLLVPSLRDVSLRRYLAVNQSENSSNSGQDSFLQSLGSDGRMLLAMAGNCCGPLAAADLTNHLWAVFKGTSYNGSAPSPSSIDPAPSSAYESAGATLEITPMTAISDTDGGDSSAVGSKKQILC